MEKPILISSDGDLKENIYVEVVQLVLTAVITTGFGERCKERYLYIYIYIYI